IVPNTSELLPEPETPVNTVSRRFGISMLTSLRLFSRAPCTRIRSWLSATCTAAVSGLEAVLIVSPSRRIRRDRRSRARAETQGTRGVRQPRGAPSRSAVLEQTEYVAVRVGERRHQAAAADVARRLVHRGAGGRHLGQ